MNARSLREQFAMVLQPSIVFPTTLRDNISYGRREATPEEIEAALPAVIPGVRARRGRFPWPAATRP